MIVILIILDPLDLSNLQELLKSSVVPFPKTNFSTLFILESVFPLLLVPIKNQNLMVLNMQLPLNRKGKSYLMGEAISVQVVKLTRPLKYLLSKFKVTVWTTSFYNCDDLAYYWS